MENSVVYMASPDKDMVANARRMRELGYNDVVLGGADEALSWTLAARCEVRALMECDTLHLPVGWEQNRIARLMHHLALDLGMVVRYAKG